MIHPECPGASCGVAETYWRDGYVHLPSVIGAAALRWVNRAVAACIERALLAGDPPSGVAVAGEGAGRRVLGLVETQRHLGAAALYLLGAPALAEAVRAVCGPDPVPTQDWLVVKNPGDGRAIGWHQDMVHDRRHPIITVGLHLDDCVADALRVVPGSQREAREICSFTAGLGYDSERVRVLEVAAGGALLHDAMLVHGSPALPAGRASRKTHYIEFRPAAALADAPGWTPALIDLRRELWTRAAGLHRRLGAEPAGDAPWLLTGEEAAFVERLLAARVRLEAANYCVPAAAGLAAAK